MPRIRQQFNSSKEIEAYYQNPNVSRAYEKIRFSSLLGGMVDQSEWQLVPEILKKNKCKKIIELASGTGRITRAMQEFSGIAVDSSPAMLEEAKQPQEP
jgi:ubiquinone/menaquinone biosynthesis C-methylase UbiE